MKFRDKKKKFKLGLIIFGILSFSALVLVVRYGDINFSHALIEFARENEPVHSDARALSRYGNKIYHYLFALFLVYGFLGRKNRKKKKYFKVALIYIVVQIIASGIAVTGLKVLVGRPRPGPAREEGFERKPFSSRTSYRSFPSGHSSDAFSSAGVIWMFSPSVPLMAASFVFSSFIAFSRILADRHYMLDVVFGALIGFLTALVLMYKKYNEDGA